MNQLDVLLNRLTVDVPEPPPVDDLRSRVHQRHRRPITVLAVLVAVLVAGVAFTSVTDDTSPNEERADQQLSAALPRAVELTVSMREKNDQPDAPIELVDTTTWPITAYENGPFPAPVFRLRSRSPHLLQVTLPKWNRPASDGATHTGNDVCGEEVCSRQAQTYPLNKDGKTPPQSLYIDVFALPQAPVKVTGEVSYVIPDTNESGRFAIEVTIFVVELANSTVPSPESIDSPTAPTTGR